MAAFNGTVIIFLIVAAVMIWRNQRGEPPKPVLAPQEKQTEMGVLTVTLFFAAPDARTLVPERREIAAREAGLEENVRAVIGELAAGPSGDAAAVLPEGAALRAVFQDGEGTLYLDFSDELRARHWGGAAGERLTIEAIRRTIAANFAAVRTVRVLVAGEPVESIAGHIDVRHPLSVGGR